MPAIPSHPAAHAEVWSLVRSGTSAYPDWNSYVNSSPPEPNGRHFGRRHSQKVFLEWNGRIPIQIPLKFVPKSPIENKPALVQVMAWPLTGDDPLPEPMIIQFIDAYICGTSGRRVKGKYRSTIYLWQIKILIMSWWNISKYKSTVQWL